MLTQKRSYKEERKAAIYEHFFSGVKIFLLPVNSIVHTCKHFLCWMRTLAVIMQMASKHQSKIHNVSFQRWIWSLTLSHEVVA